MIDFSREDLDRRQEKLLDTSVFLGKLLVAGAVFQAILFLYPDTTGLQAGLASIISASMNLLGIQSSAGGIYILVENSSYIVSQDCLGWKSMAAFIGLMFASDEIHSHRRFVAAGILALALGNIVRIVTTIYLSHIGLISFEVIHGTLWKWGLTAMVLVLWIYWMARENNLQLPLRREIFQ